MNKSIEQALTGLIPSLSGPLPPELLNLAVSLLAQSRSKASSLKQDEEIARALKQPLNLPQIVSRPPCAPRVYKKVYAYFNSALTAQEPRTPRKQRQLATEANGLTLSPSTRHTPSKGTPTVRTPSRATPLKRKIGDISGDDSEGLSSTMPAIRHLCKAFNLPAAAPHVFVGVSSVLQHENSRASEPTSAAGTPTSVLSRARTRRPAPPSVQEAPGGAIEDANIPALIVVIFLYTFVRLSGRKLDPDQYTQIQLKAIKTLLETEVGKTSPKQHDITSDVERLLRRAQSGWLKLEWYQNIAPGDELPQVDDLDGVGDDKEADSDEINVLTARRTPLKKQRKAAASKKESGSLQIGLGTMMQDKVDYLSEARRLDFLEWKAGIMARIEQIER
ncbi:hypothetical protein W97_00453 [Coniosporium apollinis CBS 100218]|uniref:ORC6 first cyclin-like domain-containing protein n=1 Tax=Coniosporium apollinis (strain CBS 100218) TaxID=1168221 RepID=R7YH56_CONA1|nr:uncharacterized protein W97_00453 [Coniosporium apollinis CBS 100218]EON61240.1 hypothetical protein W97_00453 [Coniosporium apollinis CBS 100218]